MTKTHLSKISDEELVAMARPSEPYLPQLIPQLKAAGIKSLVNVQELDEHNFCGTILKVTNIQ